MKQLLTTLLTLAFVVVGVVMPASAQEDGEYYLYDPVAKLFLSRGGSWGTEAMVDKYGVPFTWTSSTGVISFKDWNDTGLHIESNGTSLYTDNSSPTSFAFTATDGGYYLQKADKSSYARHDNGSLGEYVHMTSDASEAIVWNLLSKSERDAIVNAYPSENKAAVAKAAGFTDGFDATTANYVSTTIKTIAPTEYTWTKACNRGNATSGNPREVYVGTGNFTTSLTGLSKGIYKVSISALERDGSNENTVALANEGYYIGTSYLLVGDQQVKVKGWAEDRAGDANPNGIADAKTLFEQGKYIVEVYAYVPEDNGVLDLNVAVPSHNNGHWFIMGNTVVTYLKEGGREDFEAALTAAQEALANDSYKNVTGTEKDALSEAINTYKNVTSSYPVATQALKNATEAFIAAKTSYDSYVQEKAIAEALGCVVTLNPTTAAEAGSDNVLHTLNVAEDKAVTENYTTAIDLGDWVMTGGVADNNGQHWSGNASRTYKEQPGSGWSANSWEIGMSQTISLPAGDYAFKASGRHSADAVLSLTVTDASGKVLGAVNNFPSGDTGKGIDMDGAANFGDGEFANNNNGRGWQWRFVPFTLTEEGQVTIAVAASAAVTHQWVSFCDYTVQAKPSMAASLAAYNQSLASAKALIDNETYKCITGEERVNLQSAINKAVPSTVAEIDEAKETLERLSDTFVAAKSSYDGLAAVVKVEARLPYASEASRTAFANAQADATPASAADAVAKTEAITKALRAYYESNANAEGVEGARAIEIAGDFTGATVAYPKVGEWTATQSGGNLQVLNNQTWTNADGTAGQSYFDYYNGTANNQHGYLDVDLEPGKYLVTVRSRAQKGLETYFKAGDKAVDLQEIGNTGGVFDRGWNDAYVAFTANGTTRLEWYSTHTNGNHAGWAGFGNVRLVKIGDLDAVTLDEAATDAPLQNADFQAVTLNRPFVQGWNSVVLPFDATLEELGAVKAVAYAGTEGSVINFTAADALAANTPYLVYFDEATPSVAFAAKKVAPSAALTVADKAAEPLYDLVGTYVAAAASPVKAGDYLVNATGIVKAKGGNVLKGFRAYLAAQSTEAAAKSMTMAIDGQVVTGIEAVRMRDALDGGAAYNIAGQRVGKGYKGIVIRGGKKMLEK